MKTIEDLYETYQDAVKNHKVLLAEYRKKLHEAKQSHNQSKIAEINRIICVLYEEKLELESKTEELRAYVTKGKLQAG